MSSPALAGGLERLLRALESAEPEAAEAEVAQLLELLAHAGELPEGPDLALLRSLWGACDREALRLQASVREELAGQQTSARALDAYGRMERG